MSPIRLDMDLCCLIDSGERLSATDLVTMLGDLLERGTPLLFTVALYETLTYRFLARDQVPRQAPTPCPNSYCQAVP